MATFTDCTMESLVNEPVEMRISPPGDDNGNIWILTMRYRDTLDKTLHWVVISNASLDTVIETFCTVVGGTMP